MYSTVRRQQQATRDFFRSMGFDTDTRSGQNKKRRQQQSPAPVKKKKIEPGTGEYVKYEEISIQESTYTETRSSAGQSTSIVAEQQITDVEWEDIK